MGRNELDFSHTDLFRAYVLRPTPTSEESSGVPRIRLIDSINHLVGTGAHIVIASPIGTGKTTLALQWAAQHGKPVTFVTGHSVDHIPQHWLSAPTPYGAAAAKVLNEFAKGPDRWTDIEAALTTYRNVDPDPLPPIIDGIGTILPDVAEALFFDASQTVQAVLFRQAMFLMRAVDSDFLAMLSAGPGVRTILADDMMVTREEVGELHDSGILGEVDLDHALTVNRQEHGWISGLIASCNNERMLDSRIMNELLMRQPLDIRHAIMAFVTVPVSTQGLWYRLMEHFGQVSTRMQNVMSQIPSVSSGEAEVEYSFPQSFRRSMRRLIASYADLESLDTSYGIALRWYVENKNPDAAGNLLQQVRRSARLTGVQRAAGLPDNVIADIALDQSVQQAMGEEDERLWERICSSRGLGIWSRELINSNTRIRNWRHSDIPVWMARGYVAMAWQSWAHGNIHDCLIAAEKVMDTAPEECGVERLLATTLLYGVNTLEPGVRHDHDCESLAADEFVQNPALITYWHRFARPMQLGFMAMQGGLYAAESACLAELEECRNYDPQSAAQYAILASHIALEGELLEKAQSYTALARRLYPAIEKSVDFCILESASWSSIKDFDRARQSIERARFSSLTNPFGAFRKAMMQAAILLQEQDVNGARILMRSTPRLLDVWPRSFGNVHSALLEAQVLGVEGANQHALEVATRVAGEAHRRHHLVFEVQAYSTIAYLHHLEGRYELRNKAVASAQRMAGNRGFAAAFRVLGHDVRTLDHVHSHGVDSTEHPVKNEDLELTPRELTALRLVEAGLSNQEIADELYISLSTVKSHLANISAKLKTRKRAEAVRVARERGLIS